MTKAKRKVEQHDLPAGRVLPCGAVITQDLPPGDRLVLGPDLIKLAVRLWGEEVFRRLREGQK